jgi:GTP cyclohydrolase I
MQATQALLPPPSEDGKVYLSHSDVFTLLVEMATMIEIWFKGVERISKMVNVYAVPRGGIPVAYLLCMAPWMSVRMVDRPELADIVVDDIIDSGATMSRFTGMPFFALINKREHPDLPWIVFPWEVKEGNADEGIEDNIRRILQYVGEDSNREGLRDTPARVAKAWAFWCQGYKQNPKDVLKVFEDGAAGADEMIVVRDIEFYSHCEHHMAPFFGKAHVAYIPNAEQPKVVGLSKIARVVDIYARRLQVQERLTNEIVDCIHTELNALGAAVLIEAKHMCMCSRGVNKQDSMTITSALRGAIKDKPAARAEFLALVRP